MATLDALSLQDLIEKSRAADQSRERRFDVAPTKQIGSTTVFLLVINRTIGSGIFTVPPLVLSATKSVGASFLIWGFCGVFVLCAACCWLEVGLSVPRVSIKKDGIVETVSAPRSGGEKNFLDYIYNKPAHFIQCVYGIMYVVLGNISGNAIAFGIYVSIAANRNPYNPETGYERGMVLGLAFMALTVSAGLHIFSRRGGLIASNIFAVYKVGLLLLLILLGWVHAGGKYLQKNASTPPVRITNFKDTFGSTQTPTGQPSSQHEFSTVINAILSCCFSFTGFEQPFYVLSEVKTPRKTFPRAVLSSMATAVVLYILTNISYMLVVDKKDYTVNHKYNGLDIAGRMFQVLFDDPNQQNDFGTGRRAMAALIACSVFGNILVITFTAARVKQEIAKEGILPYSLFFASNYITPWAKLRRGRRRPRDDAITMVDNVNLDDPEEQSPIAALGLHWFSSVFLIAISAWAKQPSQSYAFLISLFSYTNTCLIGFLVSFGLIYLKVDARFNPNGRQWSSKSQWHPKFVTIPQTLFFLTTTVLLFAALAPVKALDSRYHPKTLGYQTYIVAIVGLTSLLWGVVWWLGLRWYQRKNHLELVVTREPLLNEYEGGNWLQRVEMVTHNWKLVIEPDRKGNQTVEYHLERIPKI